MAQAGSKPYFISFTLPDGSRVRERVANFEGEREMLRGYEEEYGRPITLKGRTYARSAARKSKSNPRVKFLTLRNMASVTIKRASDGSVQVSGRRLGTHKAAPRKRKAAARRKR
jgi:hypothetical protein